MFMLYRNTNKWNKLAKENLGYNLGYKSSARSTIWAIQKQKNIDAIFIFGFWA